MAYAALPIILLIKYERFKVMVVLFIIEAST